MRESKSFFIFIFLIFFLPTCADQPGKSLKIDTSYNQIMNRLDQFFVMSNSLTDDNQQRYMGESKNQLATIEIIGEKDNITSAFLMIGVPKDAPKILVENSAILLTFVNNIDPGWAESANWAMAALDKATKNREPEIIIRDNKLIKLSVLKYTGFITVSVKNKAASDV